MKTFALMFLLMPLAFAVSSPTIPLNTLPTIATMAIFILLILLATLFTNVKILGALAGLFMILLGLFIYTNSILYQTGYITMTTNTQVTNLTNGSSSVTNTINSTEVYNFQPIEFPSIISNGAPMNAGQFIGSIVILLGLYSLLFYGGRIYGEWK